MVLGIGSRCHTIHGVHREQMDWVEMERLSILGRRMESKGDLDQSWVAMGWL